MSIELANQFTELCAKLAGRVAEVVQESAMGLPRNERKRIERMLEDDLPNIVFNSMRKTVSLQNETGLKHLTDNFDTFVQMYVNQILGRS
jgi:hypothetical protein